MFSNFLACFLKLEAYGTMGVKKLKNPKELNDRQNLLSKKHIFIGKGASSIMSSVHQSDITKVEFLEKSVRGIHCMCKLSSEETSARQQTFTVLVSS